MWSYEFGNIERITEINDFIHKCQSSYIIVKYNNMWYTTLMNNIQTSKSYIYI